MRGRGERATLACSDFRKGPSWKNVSFAVSHKGEKNPCHCCFFAVVSARQSEISSVARTFFSFFFSESTDFSPPFPDYSLFDFRFSRSLQVKCPLIESSMRLAAKCFFLLLCFHCSCCLAQLLRALDKFFIPSFEAIYNFNFTTP